MVTNKKSYKAAQIKVLEGLEGVRRRPRNVHRWNRQRWITSLCS